MDMNRILKVEVKLSRLIVITGFWVMFVMSIALTAILIHYCSNIHLRNDMLFIRYNFGPLAESLSRTTEELRPLLVFNLNCMVFHIKEAIMNIEFFIVVIMFFNVNTFILLFLVYRRNKKFLYMMSIIMVIYSYLTYSYCRTATNVLQEKVLGRAVAQETEK